MGGSRSCLYFDCYGSGYYFDRVKEFTHFYYDCL